MDQHVTDEEIEKRQKAHARKKRDDQERAIRRAKAAEILLKDPMLVEAFENLEQTYTVAMRNSPIDKPEVREVYRYRIEALDLLRAELQHVLTNGNIAESERLQEETRQRLAED